MSGAILHSDRGSQYTSGAFRDRLNELGIKQRMNGTGKCYDNARMERFFATLKKEKLYRIPTHRLPMEQVKSIIFRYIMVYYNEKSRDRLNTFQFQPQPMSFEVIDKKTFTEVLRTFMISSTFLCGNA
ncbi:MAG: hypothetical protein A2Y17_01525 [Clostridiales bacterium GWF2_38_85]|nr:MAG: hypothetical protein A2Y17_01525 [Clostridiales bacterium GWF2_38_85]